MEIEQYLWGASAEGEGILLYTLRCAGGREVRLSNAGAAVTGIFAAGADGRPVTHLARGATAAPFTMTTQLFWQGNWRPTLRTQEGPATDDGRFYPVEGWRRNILGEAARLDDPAAGRTIEILTSQPEIRIVRHDGQLALLCGDSRPAPLDDETLYCQKDVYRF